MARASVEGSINSDCRQLFDDSWQSERPVSSSAAIARGPKEQQLRNDIWFEHISESNHSQHAPDRCPAAPNRAFRSTIERGPATSLHRYEIALLLRFGRMSYLKSAVRSKSVDLAGHRPGAILSRHRGERSSALYQPRTACPPECADERPKQHNLAHRPGLRHCSSSRRDRSAHCA